METAYSKQKKEVEKFEIISITFKSLNICWSVISNFNLMNKYSNKSIVRSPRQSCKLHQLSKDSEVIPDLRTNQGWPWQKAW